MSQYSNFINKLRLPENDPDEKSRYIHHDGDISNRGMSAVIKGIVATGLIIGIVGPAIEDRIGAELATDEEKDAQKAINTLPACEPNEAVVIMEREAVSGQIGKVSMCRIGAEAFTPEGN